MPKTDLIDPMNEDTYDDRVIVHGPIKSYLGGPGFARFHKNRERRKWVLQSKRSLLADLQLIFMKHSQELRNAPYQNK